MTTTLVVASNPGRDPYLRELAVVAGRALARRHLVVDLDLEAEGFEPAMSASERRAYHTNQPILDPQVARHAGLVAEASALVFVYPSVWFGLPATLKGWLDRVLVPGVAFTFNAEGRVVPALRHLRAIAGVTVHGPSRREVLRARDGGRRVLLRALRLTASRPPRKAWLALYDYDGTGPTQYVTRVENVLARL
jgi:putative NADPH-quinone reductase